MGRNQNQTIDIALVPDWAQVRFSTTPQRVTASIDGDAAEITPDGISVLSGEHELTLSAPGFVPAQLPLTIVAGVDQDLGEITLTPADATLTLNSRPTGAGVSVDGTFAGLTPLVLPLSPGRSHTIGVSKAGYRSSKRCATQ